ncbi:MAG TPA: alcohol dehydrogenase catalytic domain-containing protein [Acidimicrobiales bacterium]|nr:alcohol dehydrogenase catalytic domain-containing protein [Acidimicrobiales bacterium]
MRAVFLPGGRQVEVRSVQRPAPGPGEVLISMRAAGLCGSDLHMHYRPAPEQRRGPIFGLVTDPDVVPGHEPAGVVAEVGREVSAFHVGDRVAVHHMGGCGDCMECRRGWDINCQQKWGVYGLDRPGAMQDYMLARSRDCVHLPDEVSFAEAAYYTCGAGTGYLALKRAGLGVGDTVAVVGLGPVGLAAAYFAMHAGANVVGFDPLQTRRDLAEKLGPGPAHDPASAFAPGPSATGLASAGGALGEEVRALTGGRGADVVVESSGSAKGRVLALSLAALRGRVVCVGFGDAKNELDVQATIIQKQLDVRGAWMFPLPDLQEMLFDVARRGISISPLITGSYDIADAGEAWATFDKGVAGKVVIGWETNPS